eukprot:m.20445 g.20445  ORF g.20445 m.20445 type:complete len:120 (-) comp8576_c0_seq4:57-416(-)
MELAQQVINELKVASTIASAKFIAILKDCERILCQSSSESLIERDDLEMKQAHAGVVTLLAEAAKFHASEDTIRSILEDISFEDNRLQEIISLHNVLNLKQMNDTHTRKHACDACVCEM